MKALILNSGIGRRMGEISKDQPKCMARIGAGFSIISWQLNVLKKAGINEAVITTGPFAGELRDYIESLNMGMVLEFVANPDYENTNYIYSIYCARDYLADEIILLHGDLVFEQTVVEDLISYSGSCVATDSSLPLPEKDFKARVDGDRVLAVGVEFFGADCVACQPIYHILKNDMQMWLSEIERFCQRGQTSVYAEKALNIITDKLELSALELGGRLCNEIDNEDDLIEISSRFNKLIESERIMI